MSYPVCLICGKRHTNAATSTKRLRTIACTKAKRSEILSKKLSAAWNMPVCRCGKFATGNHRKICPIWK